METQKNFTCGGAKRTTRQDITLHLNAPEINGFIPITGVNCPALNKNLCSHTNTACPINNNAFFDSIKRQITFPSLNEVTLSPISPSPKFFNSLRNLMKGFYKPK